MNTTSVPEATIPASSSASQLVSRTQPWLEVLPIASGLVILVGAQINAEAELQTTADTTVGAPAPAGERGATVADQVSEE